MYLAYRGISVILLAPDRAVLAIVLACAMLTYGGVSLFVVAFAVYPIGVALFRQAGIPKRLLPASIALGAFTFTMTALPGTPAIQNAIPAPFFGTDAFAAPGLGIIAGLIMFGLGSWWLSAKAKKLMAAGEGYGDHKDEKKSTEPASALDNQRPVGFWLAVLPILVVIGINFLMAKQVLPSVDTSYLARPEFGGLKDAASLIGIWSIIAALVAAILLLVAMHWHRWTDLTTTVNDGAFGSMLPS